MKKVLLGTTALVALGVLPIAAQAADKIQLGLSGYYRFYAVGASLDDGTDASSPTGMEVGAGIRDHGVGREGEIHFRGQTTLDNGIKVGVRVELEAETSLDQIDNSYIYFDGGFGRVEMGSMWGPGVIMHYGSTGHVAGAGSGSGLGERRRLLLELQLPHRRRERQDRVLHAAPRRLPARPRLHA